MKKLLALFAALFIVTNVSGQVKDYELGSSLLQRYNQQTGFYDLSDPESVNIKVAVWGYVRFPGKYIVPIYTSVLDLLSYAGGPTEAAHLDDLRIYRINPDSSQSLIKVNYNDIMYESELESKEIRLPHLEAGDVLVVPGAPRLYTRETVSIIVSILSALISLTILILNITRN
jgi:protein involved in polysaccharide export with SLBB domain